MLTGIHHVTCIAGDAQENLDFYTGILGMRLVKKSINQDVPDTYHLFFADADGNPGTDLTFFPWPKMGPLRQGHGLAAEVALAVPEGSLAYWSERLARYRVATGDAETRRGARVLPVTDPHGLELALVETTDARDFSPWDRSPVPEAQQVRGLESVRLLERELAPTVAFLSEALGFQALGDEGGWHRFGLGDGGSGAYLELHEAAQLPRGGWGVGAMHHVAWRVPDEETQQQVRARVAAGRRRPTEVIDRFWFKSVYFTEPGGVLFEVATDGPGFQVDERRESLGEALVLPPWFESHRAEIEAALPPLTPGVVADP